MKQVVLYNIPKISFNKFYAGKHWSVRNKIKNDYKLIVKNQFKGVFSAKDKYKTEYIFEFKTKPLDCTNVALMVKLIEDIIFEDDNYKIIEYVGLKSTKGKEDKLIINIYKL